jgi:hypothetical protein
MKDRILKILAQMKDSGNNYVSFPAIAYEIMPELEQIEKQIISLGRLDTFLPSLLTEEDKRITRVVYLDTPKVRQERRKLSAKRRGILIRVLKILWDLEEDGYLKTINCDGDFEKDEADMVWTWVITDKIKEEQT